MLRHAYQALARPAGKDSGDADASAGEAIRQLREELQALRQSEQRLHDFAATRPATDWFWETDTVHRFTYLSDNFATATGFPASELLGRKNEALIACVGPRSDSAGWPAVRDIQFSLDENSSHTLNALPFFDESGNFSGYRGSARPAGGLNEAELNAERASRLLQEAVNEIACGFTIYDEHDRLVTCNQSYRDIYATSADLIVPGTTFAEILRTGAERGQYKAARGDIDAWVQERVAQHQNPSGQPIEQELDDGRWLLIVENRTPSGYIVGNRIEITDRKRAEVEQQRLTRALRLATECIAAVVHAGDEAGLLADICRKVVTTGGYALSWVGLACDDAEGSVQPVASYGDAVGYLDDIRISWREDLELGRGLVGPAIFTGTAQLSQDFADAPQLAPWRERIARYGFQSAAALPLTVNQRTIGALALYATTVDAFSASEMELLNELAENLSFGIQSLRARRELEHHQRGLEQLVAMRTRQISELNHRLAERAKEAESASRAKSDFLATMSHEIRTPINAVLGLTEMLAETSLNRRQQDYARKIQLSAESLRALVDDILDFSRIEAGALTLDRQAFSLHKMLQTVAMISSVSARDKAIEILFDIPPDVPDALIGDSLRLQQILLNLTNNAVKFTERGTIVLAVRVQAQDDDSVQLEFAVRDTGIGIAAEKLDQIFQVFTQADSSISRTHGGSGLGLAICARLAELMEGTISVSSQPGEGSEFRLSARWPLAPASPAAVTIPPELAGLRILIVDDHALARRLLGETCAAFGWRATEAASAAEGIRELQAAAAEGDDYDLMLLDWRMPETDGLQMLGMAHATPGLGLPLVVLMAPPHQFEQAFNASNDYLLDGLVAKPLTPAMLLDAVRNAHSGEMPQPACPRRQFARKLAGLRLLVAEDNAINRELIEDILTRAGAEVVLANDGQAAVQALRTRQADFDAVLMDIQMPVLDGYSATRVIRQELGLTELPIIAVTANAMSSSIRQAREAGMNGLVLKPIDIDELLAAISLKRDGPVKSPEAPRPQSEFPGLAADALTHFGDDPRHFAALLGEFAHNHATDMASVMTAFRQGDHARAARLIHQFGGVAAFLRASEVPRLARAAESALRGNSPQDAAPLLGELQAAMDVLLAGIARFESAAGNADHPAAGERGGDPARTGAAKVEK